MRTFLTMFGYEARERMLRAMVAATAASAAGCNFDASGTGNGPTPQLCEYDMEVSHVFIDDAPDSGLVEDGTLYDGEDFLIVWNVCRHAPNDAEPAGAQAHATRVEVTKDGELFWYEEYDAEPIYQHECQYDQVYVEEGLPPGHYSVRVEVNLDSAIYECTSPAYYENNVATRGIDVLALPIDDVTTGVEDGGGDPPGPQFVAGNDTDDGAASQDAGDDDSDADDSSSSKPDPSDTDPGGRDPIDPGPVDPPRPQPIGGLTAGGR